MNEVVDKLLLKQFLPLNEQLNIIDRETSFASIHVLKQHEEGQLARSFEHPPLREESCKSFVAIGKVVLINFPLEHNLLFRVWVDVLLKTFEVRDVSTQHYFNIQFG
jgi:hypothetical protein